MQLVPSQLSAHLEANPLPLVISVFGDTPLLIDDSLQVIRKRARQQGAEERLRWLQDSQFDWQQLVDQSASLSLFSNLRLIELELPEGKPGREGSEALKNYLQAPPSDQILVIIGPKLKQEQLKSKWYLQLAAAGPVVTANTPERKDLPRFIQHRAQTYQLQLAADTTQLLADWFEGNLLALDQELQILALADLPKPVALSRVQETAQDQSRFSVFALQEAILRADVEDALHRLARLFDEDVEVAILNWMLQREWQTVNALKHADNFATACKQNGIWRSQEALYRGFCQRLTQPALQQAARLLVRLEYAFKRDSGDNYRTLATHLVTLYCQPEAVVGLPQ